MSTFRRPKGSYVRNTPDFWALDAYAVGANNPSATGKFAVTDLYNNGQAGQILHVWDLYIQNSGSESIRVQQVQGNVGGPNGPPWPIYFNNKGGIGQIYYNQVASRTSPASDMYITSVNTPVIDRINPPGPVAIIPPGWSLRLINNQTDFGFIAWFYYLVMQDIS